jgi:hypothetical protein
VLVSDPGLSFAKKTERNTTRHPTNSSSTCWIAVYCSLEHYVSKLNPALFEPLTRIENARRRVSGAMLTASNLAPKQIDLVQREIQEIQEALEEFRAAVEAGETTWFQNGSLRAHDQPD